MLIPVCAPRKAISIEKFRLVMRDFSQKEVILRCLASANSSSNAEDERTPNSAWVGNSFTRLSWGCLSSLSQALSLVTHYALKSSGKKKQRIFLFKKRLNLIHAATQPPFPEPSRTELSRARFGSDSTITMTFDSYRFSAPSLTMKNECKIFKMSESMECFKVEKGNLMCVP